MRRITALAALLSTALLPTAAFGQENGDDVQVMIVGVYHFANPGLDEYNMEVGSVLTPRRQAELEDLAQALSA